MNKISIHYLIKKTVNTATVVFFSSLVFLSCKKEIASQQKIIGVQVINNDSINGRWGIMYDDIIALPDNSFWLHFSLNYTPPFKERFEHYDENFNLLNTKVIDSYRFIDFVVNGNNDIVTSAQYYNSIDKVRSYRFLKLDNNFHFLENNSTPEIMKGFEPLKDRSFKSYLTKLSNGNYIFGFYTAHGYGVVDSASSILASYNDPLKSGVPNWVNKNFYYDNSLGIKQSRIIEIASDTKNNFYILCGTNPITKEYALIVRKHNEQGDLIWQKRIMNTPGYNETDYRLNFEEGRIFISSPSNKLYIFDENGTFTEKQLPVDASKFFIPTLNSDGYITVTHEINKVGNYATMLKLDKNFNLIKSKRFGNQGTFGSIGMARLPNGKIILSGFVENPTLKGLDLMQLKVNDDLELVE